MDFRRAGSFRQRARNAERTTRQLKEHRRQRVIVRTAQAIEEFEEHLRTVQESSSGYDDLPMDAEAGHLHHASTLRGTSRDKASLAVRDNGSDASSTVNRGAAWRSLSVSQHGLHGGGKTAACGGLDGDLMRFCHRPPSPLTMYDYGGISTRPRSILAQRSKGPAESMRPSFRHSSPGFYFPGPDCRQGPYGFSMMEPIHMPPRGWEAHRDAPHRWPRDPSDVRPATTEGREHRHRRSRTAGPVASEAVRSNTAHDLRASRTFSAIDRRNEESQLEAARFQSGVFDGRWRDPLLDAGGSAAVAAPLPAHCPFLAEEDEDAPAAQQVASKLLFGIEAALTRSRGNLKSLFRAVNNGTVGVLEPPEFLLGLERLGIVKPGELTVESVVAAAAKIDPGFDGRINFSVLERAVASARSIQRQRDREAERLGLLTEHRRSNTYGEKLPIDVVRVERMPKSLFDFERAFERFRKQQKELLAHHGELAGT